MRKAVDGGELQKGKQQPVGLFDQLDGGPAIFFAQDSRMDAVAVEDVLDRIVQKRGDRLGQRRIDIQQPPSLPVLTQRVAGRVPGRETTLPSDSSKATS